MCVEQVGEGLATPAFHRPHPDLHTFWCMVHSSTDWSYLSCVMAALTSFAAGPTTTANHGYNLQRGISTSRGIRRLHQQLAELDARAKGTEPFLRRRERGMKGCEAVVRVC